jgi:fructokinase
MIVVCGEALVDLTPVKCEGEGAYAPRVGGSPLNVAVGLARLGVSAAFFGRVSTDTFGERIVEHLSSNGVDLRFVRRGPGPSTLAIVDVREGREPAFLFYGEGGADRLLLREDVPATFGPEVSALHFGSISLALEPVATTLESCIHREHSRRVVTLDPNVRPSLIRDRASYVHRLEEWIGLVGVVRASRADVAWLYPDVVLEAVLDRWMELGAGIAVISLGADGALGECRAGSARAPGRRVEVVDTVGAGDAFMAGLLAWLEVRGALDRTRLGALGADELESALRWAIEVAAITCARAGADRPGLRSSGSRKARGRAAPSDGGPPRATSR